MALDSSGPALARLKENAELNGLANIEPRKANVFEELARLEAAGERFDLIVLDPPAFAKSKKDVAAARKGYRELNRRAMSLLASSGVLLTCSCSANLSGPDFLEVLRASASDARRQFRLLQSLAQPSDHPVLLAMPETQYLKGCILHAPD